VTDIHTSLQNGVLAIHPFVYWLNQSNRNQPTTTRLSATCYFIATFLYLFYCINVFLQLVN